MSFFNKLIVALCAALFTLAGCDDSTSHSYDLVALHGAETDLDLAPSNNATIISFSIVNQSDQQIELRSIPILIESLYGDPILSNVVADIKLRGDDGRVFMGPLQIPAGTSDRFETSLEDSQILQPGETVSLHLEMDIVATQNAQINVTIGDDAGILYDAIFSNDPTGAPPTTSVDERIGQLVTIIVVE